MLLAGFTYYTQSKFCMAFWAKKAVRRGPLFVVRCITRLKKRRKQGHVCLILESVSHATFIFIFIFWFGTNHGLGQY